MGKLETTMSGAAITSTLTQMSMIGDIGKEILRKFGIKKIDIIFIPLSIFDLSGHRVGYGKGYYDRFLKSLNSNTVKIGLSLFEPVEEIIDINNDDVSMDICVTPNSIYDFK